MTLPLWASFASIVVALIQPLQHALNHHMPPIKGFLNSVGDCSIPVTLVVLGAYFYLPPVRTEERERSEAGDDLNSLDDEERSLLPINKGKNYGAHGIPEAGLGIPGSAAAVDVGFSDNNPRSPLPTNTRFMSSLRRIHSSFIKRPATTTVAITPGETKTVFVAIFSRMILTPIIVLPLIAELAMYKVHRIFQEFVFVFLFLRMKSY